MLELALPLEGAVESVSGLRVLTNGRHCGVLIMLFSVLHAQLACGFTMFLFPGARQWLRAVYLPLHVYFGLAIFAMAVATALLGISEKLFFKL